ncbi:MAG: LysM peptidoglycan-binding domain-containing protein [Nocardioides sp.]
MNDHRAGLPRCLTVWLLAGVLAAGLVAWLVPVAANGSRGPVTADVLLVRLCAAAAVPAVAWLWILTTVVTLQAARGRLDAVRGVPTGVRRVVLAACGVALVGSAVAPAGAAEPGPVARDQRVTTVVARLVAGLPLPDRATTPRRRAPVHRSPAPRHGTARPERTEQPPRTVTVRPGDTLWSIAARDLAPGTSAADVNTHWQAIYAANRALIGGDPDVIEPAQRLRLPRA